MLVSYNLECLQETSEHQLMCLWIAEELAIAGTVKWILSIER